MTSQLSALFADCRLLDCDHVLPVTSCTCKADGGCPILGTSVQILTTHMVLTEALDATCQTRHGPRRTNRSPDMLRGLSARPHVEIIPQSDAQFRAAVERYAVRSDQRWSLTDCASFLAMEERGITEALAYDRDFEQAGFVALLRQV